MSKKPNQSRIDVLTTKRDQAAKRLEVCAKRFRSNASGPMADICEDEMDEAFEALTLAGQDLRQERDGYRYTHPRGCGHPSHVNCICYGAKPALVS
jgi:hypothetical protein